MEMWKKQRGKRRGRDVKARGEGEGEWRHLLLSVGPSLSFHCPLLSLKATHQIYLQETK
jgi:hypothetical protein